MNARLPPDPAPVVATKLSNANPTKAEFAAANLDEGAADPANLTEAHLVEANLGWT